MLNALKHIFKNKGRAASLEMNEVVSTIIWIIFLIIAVAAVIWLVKKLAG